MSDALQSLSIPRLIVAGPASHVGKTTVTLGLIQALKKRGLEVAAFKCGPDYIDPTYHARVSGRTCHNLDGWMMGREAVLSTFIEGSRGADIAVIEGVMGLFDGLSADSDVGSTAEIAKWLQAPVVLVVDASRMARSIAPIVRGMEDFDSELEIAAVVANFIGSDSHLSTLRTAVGRYARAKLVGGLLKTPEHAFPERHLGLHGAEDQDAVSEESLHSWGELCESRLDLNQLIEVARKCRPLQFSPERSHPTKRPTSLIGQERCRIGVASDAAFHFYYADNLQKLRDAGAEIIFFSPIRDHRLPSVDGLYIGGGYPELHAGELAGNLSLIEEIRRHAKEEKPIYAECGGLMYLSDRIITTEGESFPMVSLIPGQIEMGKKLKALGYVEAVTESATILGAAGLRFRGHQFRYSELKLADESAVTLSYRVRRRRGNETSSEGYCRGNVLASYVHAHWASNPLLAQGFVESCARENRARENRVRRAERRSQ